jgi:hypothetical protein
MKKSKFSKYPNFQSRTKEDPTIRPFAISIPNFQPIRGLVVDKGIVLRLGELESFGGENVKLVVNKQEEVFESLAIHCKGKVKDIVSIYVGVCEQMPTINLKKLQSRLLKNVRKLKLETPHMYVVYVFFFTLSKTLSPLEV